MEIKDYVLKNYEKDEYYNNIYILLKMLYLKYENETEITINIPELYFLNIYNLMIISSQNVIQSFFLHRNTIAIDENVYIKKKFDLYISLLTYICYYKYLPKLDKNIHLHIKDCICNNNPDNSLLSSEIYKFKIIPNDVIEKFFEKTFVNNNNDNVQRLTCHLLYIHDFYNYILNFLINNKNFEYKNHPLEDLTYKIL